MIGVWEGQHGANVSLDNPFDKGRMRLAITLNRDCSPRHHRGVYRGRDHERFGVVKVEN